MLKDSGEFFLRKEQFDIYEAPRVELSSGVFVNDSTLTRTLSCGVWILISAFFQSVRQGAYGDPSDVINLSYFKAIPPKLFGMSICCTLIIMALTRLIRTQRIGRAGGHYLLEVVIREAKLIANQPGQFSKLTMIFLLPHYWNYCIDKALLSGSSFPLTHQDGESTLRNWAFSELDDLGVVEEVLCFLSTHSIWVFHDLNSLQIVTKYHTACLLANIIISEDNPDLKLLRTLAQIEASHPSKVLYGSKPISLGEGEGDKIYIRSSTLTLKGAIKSLPTPAEYQDEKGVGRWRGNSTAGAVVVWNSSETIFEHTFSAPHYSQSIGIHATRLVCRLTSTPMKIAPICTYLNITEGLMFCVGDGSGGITAYLLSRYRTSFLVFNTLIDHENEILQSTGTVLPPAVYLLPESDRQRLLNQKECTSGPSDLTDKDTVLHLSTYQATCDSATTLIFCEDRKSVV